MIRYAMLPITAPLLDFQDSDAPRCPRLIDASDDAAGIVDWRIEGDCEWEDASGQHRLEGSIVARGDTNGTELEYRGFRQETERAQACGSGQQIDTMALTGVVRVPFALDPPAYGESRPPLPEDAGTGHYDIRILFEVSGTLGGDAALFHPGAPASCFGDEQTECTAWSLNGEEQSELCGFAGRSKGYGCSAGPDAPPPWAAMIPSRGWADRAALAPPPRVRAAAKARGGGECLSWASWPLTRPRHISARYGRATLAEPGRSRPALSARHALPPSS